MTLGRSKSCVMKINCPECDQEFNVSEDLLGTKVECGSCDHPFTLSEEHVSESKERAYPSEGKNKGLGKFNKKPTSKASEVTFTPASYQSDVNPDLIGPPRPRRILAMAAGICLMAVVIIAFLLMGGKEGPMRDVETNNRFVLCGFSALLGSALVIYGASHNRLLGVLMALILSVILMFMPVIFPGNPISSFISEVDMPVIEEASESRQEPKPKPESIQDYLIRIGNGPVEEAMLANPRETVVGIYLRNADYKMQAKIASYLYYSTGRASREVIFPRGDTGTAALILLLEQVKGIEEIAALCKRFGKVVRMEKNWRVIEVYVESSEDGEVDQVKLNDPQDPDFESLNLKALNDLDPREQMQAVTRLTTFKPGPLRDEITRQFVDMLPDSHSGLQLEIIKALQTWAKPESDIGEALLHAARELHMKDKVSRECMELLIARKVNGSEVILLDLWKLDPTEWSDLVIQLGAGAEVLLLPQLAIMTAEQVSIASGILGKVGTKDCLKYLQDLVSKPGLDAKKIKSLQAAIDEIKKRS